MHFVNPIAGVVTSGYADDRPHPVLGIVAPHWGADAAGRPRGVRHGVGAIADGTVVAVRDDSHPGDKRRGLLSRLTGNGVIVDHGTDEHGRSVRSYMGHGVNLAVQPGDVVRAGDRLFDQGATGNVSGAHVHLEIWVAGQTVDPVPYLRARGVELGAGPTIPPPTTTTHQKKILEENDMNDLLLIKVRGGDGIILRVGAKRVNVRDTKEAQAYLAAGVKQVEVTAAAYADWNAVLA